MKNTQAKIYFNFNFFYFWFSRVGFGFAKMDKA